MASYECATNVRLGGELRFVGDRVELDPDDARPLLDRGVLRRPDTTGDSTGDDTSGGGSGEGARPRRK